MNENEIKIPELDTPEDVAKYARYPAVPDFGALIGAQCLSEGETEDGWYYLYDNAAADEDALAEYYQAMTAWGFDYAFDKETQCMVFTSEEHQLTVYGSTKELEAVKYYEIRIAAGVVDTTALQQNSFPW